MPHSNRFDFDFRNIRRSLFNWPELEFLSQGGAEQVIDTAPSEYRRTSETAGKSGKRIERCVIATFQIGESMASRRFSQWGASCVLEIDLGLPLLSGRHARPGGTPLLFAEFQSR